MKKIKLFIVFFFLIVFSVFSQNPNKKYETYTAIEGETLQSIARKFSITPFNLIQLNPELVEGGDLNGKIIIVPNKNYKPDTGASNNGEDYIENGFLIHTVLVRENYFRFKKKYGVSKRILRKHNPILRIENLKVGQVIKIPVKDDFKLESDTEQITETKPYIVKPREAKYGISKRYGISIEQLEELNPQTKGRDLKMAELILVPDIEEVPEAEEGFTIHKVLKGETFFSLGQLYAISQDDLISVNPELTDGVKEGMLIKIPVVEESSKLVFIPSIDPDKELKAALMLPFMTNRRNIDFEKSITSDIATDFYLGAMMALDSVKKLGLSVNLKVFDTQNNKTLISRYIIENDFSDTDVIIGPLFIGNVELISKALQNKNVVIVSPVSQKDHSVFGSNKLIQDTPSHEKLMNKVLNHIKSNYNGENIVIFSDTTKTVIPQLAKTLAVLEPLDSLTKIEIIKPKEGYFMPELFREKIVKEKDNILILITEDPVVTKDVVQNLGVLPKEINATFFAMNKGSNFNEVNNNYLAHVNFHYPVSSFIDWEDENVKKFVRSYKFKNKAVPSDYSFKGFDVTYDALLRCASFDDIASALKAGYSNRIATKYEYDSNGYGKGFINQGVYILKYDGLNIVKVEDYSTDKKIEE
jgi:LysM repeat protein